MSGAFWQDMDRQGLDFLHKSGWKTGLLPNDDGYGGGWVAHKNRLRVTAPTVGELLKRTASEESRAKRKAAQR